ncbi:zinc-binding dehydrogenase, partial [Herbaspirillum sp.]|uniref:zinc-binding dehydrogenase n=1 Tax=Herbaspirillum sp. TaxID=1890675 RepID=UPI0025898493
MCECAGCAMSGCSRILAVDINPMKFAMAKALGATECVNPQSAEYADRRIQDVLVELTGGGV